MSADALEPDYRPSALAWAIAATGMILMAAVAVIVLEGPAPGLVVGVAGGAAAAHMVRVGVREI